MWVNLGILDRKGSLSQVTSHWRITTVSGRGLQDEINSGKANHEVATEKHCTGSVSVPVIVPRPRQPTEERSFGLWVPGG